ncbi:hypothetical protein STRIP9103_02691 [Streptomyces ipomoeae 91-03]|jgi:hypothetical protein|uniref:Lipoprotein n=1 Tax=Streptomyces ipomoeae 91-03 TaxID=698759 RepID=L1L1E3_9ACTN|nr:hypothetical protein STRIP9103_02691 [Streptomyces ipomoeae 91-03]
MARTATGTRTATITRTTRTAHTRRIALAALAGVILTSVAACGAHAKDGSVKLELGVVPDLVESRSDDGSISIGLPRDASYRVETDSDDGFVDVSVPRDEDSSHVVTAHTRDGSVTVRNLG